MKCRGWCGLCYANRRARANYKGHWGYRRPAPKYVTPWWEIADMKRPTHGCSDRPLSLKDDPILGDCPQVGELMTDGKWDDGTDRALSTLMLFRQDGRWKVCLSDKAMGRVAFATGATSRDAIDSLELQLQDGTVDWRLASGGKDRSGGKRS